jgi:hypothetical protein
MIRSMSEAYPPGRLAAQKTHEYFARTASAPSVDDIEAVIDAAFWTSLRREEGYVPLISLVLLQPEQAVDPLKFEKALPLTAAGLAKVSPAVVRPGLHAAVWRIDDRLSVWGTVRSIPVGCCVIEVVAPGLMVIKNRPREQSRKFMNIAVLEGDRLKVIDRAAAMTGVCPSFVSSLLGSASAMPFESVDVLVELAVSMRAHARGGALLIVPSDGSVWRESLVHPISYAVSPQFSGLSDLIAAHRAPHARPWDAEFAEAIDLIAGLTAVDGATVVTDRFELIAFGAKIARRDGQARVEQVSVTEPIEGMVPIVMHPTELGGTRHLSAVQFVQDQCDALAMVASQDGRFTVFSWSDKTGMVHAHRVETLLL